MKALAVLAAAIGLTRIDRFDGQFEIAYTSVSGRYPLDPVRVWSMPIVPGRRLSVLGVPAVP